MSEAKTAINHYRRTHAWDYARGASLFITIAVSPRRPLFGQVEGARVELSELGRIVDGALAAIPRLNPGIRLYGRVVMPDHIHFNVYLEPGLREPLKVLGKAIGRVKVYTTKQAKLLGRSPSINAGELPGRSPSINAGVAPGRSPSINAGVAPAHSPGNSARCASVDAQAAPARLWQQGYHDRLCLKREFIDATERYIAYNPLKWQLMHGPERALAIHEPLDSPVLDAGDYWKGVGNVALLGEKLVALRISRRCSPRQIESLLARLRRAVALGYVILSGFVSPGEKVVRDWLCREMQARFIRILPSAIPNARYKPESRYVEAFAAGRYLEIAKGNDEVEFSRGVCLDYNAEIVEMARASAGGYALYLTEQGLKLQHANGERAT